MTLISVVCLCHMKNVLDQQKRAKQTWCLLQSLPPLPSPQAPIFHDRHGGVSRWLSDLTSQRPQREYWRNWNASVPLLSPFFSKWPKPCLMICELGLGLGLALSPAFPWYPPMLKISPLGMLCYVMFPFFLACLIRQGSRSTFINIMLKNHSIQRQYLYGMLIV